MLGLCTIQLHNVILHSPFKFSSGGSMLLLIKTCHSSDERNVQSLLYQQNRLRMVFLIIQPFAIHEFVIIAIPYELVMRSPRLKAFLDTNYGPSVIPDVRFWRSENIFFNFRVHVDGPQNERHSGSVEHPYLVARPTSRIAESVAAASCPKIRLRAGGRVR